MERVVEKCQLRAQNVAWFSRTHKLEFRWRIIIFSLTRRSPVIVPCWPSWARNRANAGLSLCVGLRYSPLGSRSRLCVFPWVGSSMDWHKKNSAGGEYGNQHTSSVCITLYSVSMKSHDSFMPILDYRSQNPRKVVFHYTTGPFFCFTSVVTCMV